MPIRRTASRAFGTRPTNGREINESSGNQRGRHRGNRLRGVRNGPCTEPGRRDRLLRHRGRRHRARVRRRGRRGHATDRRRHERIPLGLARSGKLGRRPVRRLHARGRLPDPYGRGRARRPAVRAPGVRRRRLRSIRTTDVWSPVHDARDRAGDDGSVRHRARRHVGEPDFGRRPWRQQPDEQRNQIRVAENAGSTVWRDFVQPRRRARIDRRKQPVRRIARLQRGQARHDRRLCRRQECRRPRGRRARSIFRRQIRLRRRDRVPELCDQPRRDRAAHRQSTLARLPDRRQCSRRHRLCACVMHLQGRSHGRPQRRAAIRARLRAQPVETHQPVRVVRVHLEPRVEYRDVGLLPRMERDRRRQPAAGNSAFNLGINHRF